MSFAGCGSEVSWCIRSLLGRSYDLQGRRRRPSLGLVVWLPTWQARLSTSGTHHWEISCHPLRCCLGGFALRNWDKDVISLPKGSEFKICLFLSNTYSDVLWQDFWNTCFEGKLVQGSRSMCGGCEVLGKGLLMEQVGGVSPRCKCCEIPGRTVCGVPVDFVVRQAWFLLTVPLAC